MHSQFKTQKWILLLTVLLLSSLACGLFSGDDAPEQLPLDNGGSDVQSTPTGAENDQSGSDGGLQPLEDSDSSDGESAVEPSALAAYAVSGSVEEAFRFGAVIARVRAAPGAYALALVGAAVAVLVVAPLGLIACSIGVFATLAYSFLITGHLNGQAYLAASDTQAPEIGTED